jgi:1-pyrroline-5-carboxylate dehydrogenase
MWNSKIDVPLYIGRRTGDTKTMSAPHDHKHIVGTYHQAQNHIEDAIATALQAKRFGQIWPGNNALEFF